MIKPIKSLNNTDAFRKAINQLLQNSYTDLYDDNCGNETPDLLKELDQLIQSYFVVEQKEDFEKFFFCALALYLSVLPALKASLTPDQYLPFFQVQKFIPKVPKTLTIPLEIPRCENCPGIVSESVFVVQDFVRLLNGQNIHKSLLEMIDNCIIGAAIAHGSDDKRTIFKWFMQNVLVAAYEKKRA